jgi:hypothetical protein
VIAFRAALSPPWTAAMDMNAMSPSSLRINISKHRMAAPWMAQQNPAQMSRASPLSSTSLSKS